MSDLFDYILLPSFGVWAIGQTMLLYWVYNKSKDRKVTALNIFITLCAWFNFFAILQSLIKYQ